MLLCIVVLNVGFPHELLKFLYLLSKSCLVTLCAYDLTQLKLLLEGGPEVKFAITVLVDSRVFIGRGLNACQVLRGMDIHRLVYGFCRYIAIVVARDVKALLLELGAQLTVVLPLVQKRLEVRISRRVH